MTAYGFVGLGQIGALMAKHLPAADLIVYDIRPEAAAPLVEKGARAASALAEVAEAPLISIMVRDDEQVEEVVSALLPEAAAGTVIAIHSTIHAATAERLAGTAAGRGIEIIDAPVSGGFMGADAARLAVMVGGSPEAFAKVEGPFAAFADLVLHMGPVGSGTRAKLARNLLHFTAFTAAAEAQRLAEAAGISLNKLGRVVRHSDAVTGGPGAIMVRQTTARMDPTDPLHDIMRHTQALGEKDLTLALALADSLNVDTPLARLALQWFAPGLGLEEMP